MMRGNIINYNGINQPIIASWILLLIVRIATTSTELHLPYRFFFPNGMLKHFFFLKFPYFWLLTPHCIWKKINIISVVHNLFHLLPIVSGWYQAASVVSSWLNHCNILWKAGVHKCARLTWRTVHYKLLHKNNSFLNLFIWTFY